MAKNVKYDTEHCEEIYEWLAREVEKLEKEVNDKYAYHEVACDTVDGYPEAYSTTKDDALSIKVSLGVVWERHKPKGYKKDIAWFYLQSSTVVTDLYLNPQDKYVHGADKFNTVQLKTIRTNKEKERMYYGGPYPDISRFLSKAYADLAKKVEDTILEKYGTKCICNKKPVGVGGGSLIFKKGNPEQYKDYFVGLIKESGMGMKSYIVESAKENYGVTITQEDLDKSPVKKMVDPLDQVKNMSAEELHKAALKQEIEEKKTKKEEEKKVEVVKEKKWSRKEEKLLDEILDIDKKEERRKKREKRRREREDSNPIKSFFSIIATPFIWLGEHIGDAAKAVGGFFAGIFGGLWHGIVKVCSAIGRFFKGLFYGVDKSDLLFVIIPTLIMITLFILGVSDLIKDTTWAVKFKGTLFNYSMELSGFARGWLKSTDHGFFSAITLGLVQVLLIVLLFIVDLLVHIVLFVLAILWCLLQLLIQVGYLYILPVLIPVYLLIKLLKNDEKALTGICLVISIICSICHFIFIL